MDTLTQVKRNFTEVKEIRNQIKSLLEALSGKIEKLKALYVDFISRNSKNLDIFGLDSFHFQNKMLDFEYKHMMSNFTLISNRMYGGYYKLYQLIVQYAKENIADKSVLDACQIGKKSFPRYKDLEPDKVYDFDVVLDVHHTVVNIITEMDTYLTSKEDELKSDRARSDHGLNIENFIHAVVYKNTLLKSQIELFTNYVLVFHKYHSKYLRRFRLKLMFLYKQIDSDVDLEQTSVNQGFDKKKVLRRKNSDDVGVALDDMREIMTTFSGGEDSPGAEVSAGEYREVASIMQAAAVGDIGVPGETHTIEDFSVESATPDDLEENLPSMADASEVTDVPDNVSDDEDDDMGLSGLKLKVKESQSFSLNEDDDNTVIT
jgi:hypothetical protein